LLGGGRSLLQSLLLLRMSDRACRETGASQRESCIAQK
jgi:hypothetical protein